MSSHNPFRDLDVWLERANQAHLDGDYDKAMRMRLAWEYKAQVISSRRRRISIHPCPVIDPLTVEAVGRVGQAAIAKTRLAKQGWAVVRPWGFLDSSTLIVVTDKNFRYGRVDIKWEHLPRWTTEELSKVRAYAEKGRELFVATFEQVTNMKKQIPMKLEE